MTRFTQVVLLGAASVAFSGLASAAQITPCVANTGLTSAQLSGLTCELGDKIFSFSSFSAPTVSDAGTAVVTLSGPSGSPFLGAYNVIVSDSLGGAITSGFTLNYSVSVDAGLAPFNYIKNFASGILDSSTNATLASNVASLTGGATCNASSNDNNGTITPTNCNGLIATSINVSDAFTYSTVGDGLSSVSNTFSQAVGSATPEPTTFVLMGAGLGLLGMLRRKTVRR